MPLQPVHRPMNVLAFMRAPSRIRLEPMLWPDRTITQIYTQIVSSQ